MMVKSLYIKNLCDIRNVFIATGLEKEHGDLILNYVRKLC